MINSLTYPNKIRLTATEWLNKCLAFAQKEKAAIAIWKMPMDNTIHLLMDTEGGKTIKDVQLGNLDEGFFIHPFHDEKEKYFFSSEITAEIPFHQIIENENEPADIRWKQIPEVLEKQIADHDKGFIFKNLQKPSGIQATSKEDYVLMVQNAIRAISSHEFYKVVPSKIRIDSYTSFPDCGKTFLEACRNYPNAFVNLHFSPHTGLWLGASPETLIEEQHDKYFKTMALAGTQKIDSQNIADTSWTQKEIEEQAFVARYIINCFKKIRLREFEELGPKTVQAGHLLHLKTTFKVDLEKVNFPELGSVMLELLHPTSAICGMPKEPALRFLAVHEKHDRQLFSGYLGPVNSNGKSHLFVNLRCSQFLPEQVVFYAGAGVTEDSRPEKEWEETEMKCNVLSNIIVKK